MGGRLFDVVAPGLDHMVLVVEADADDLARIGDDGKELDLGELVVLRGSFRSFSASPNALPAMSALRSGYLLPRRRPRSITPWPVTAP
jgi:hypothetical protein